jgi:hypothetical protein
MLIGSKQHSAGDRIRYEVDYIDWLDTGRTIRPNNFSAAVSSGTTTAVIDTVSVTADKLYFFVNGGANNEAFTVQVSVTDTLGEVVVDTINFTITAP